MRLALLALVACGHGDAGHPAEIKNSLPKLDPQRVEAAAADVSQRWTACTGDIGPLADPAATITIHFVPCCCDGENCGRTARTPAAKLREYFNGCDMRLHYISDRIKCNADCCTYDGDIHDGDANTLLGACFAAAADGHPVISSLTIGLGP